MHRIHCLLRGSIGKKILMALSGLVLFLFLAGHLLGNLLIFQGPEAINAYANWLQSNPLLWLIRLSMLFILALHIHLALSLTQSNKRARPIPYTIRHDIQLSYAARFMLLGGIVIATFVLFHIGHLTLGWINYSVFNQLDANGHPDVYARLIAGFQNIWISLIYILAIGVIGFHLSHALKSFFQTLGIHHQNSQQLIRYLIPLLVIVLCLAFISIPLSVLLGFVGSDGGMQ